MFQIFFWVESLAFIKEWELVVISNLDTHKINENNLPSLASKHDLQPYLTDVNGRGVAYARSHKVEVASAGVSEANRGRREVATFATARFN